MARQLAAAGDDVPLLFLIDSPDPGRGRFPRSFDDHEILVDFAADLARTAGRENLPSLEQLRGLDFEAMRNGGLARAIEGSEIGREIGAERLQRLHGVYRANRLALEGYEPGPYPGRAVLIRAGRTLAYSTMAQRRVECPRARWRHNPPSLRRPLHDHAAADCRKACRNPLGRDRASRTDNGRVPKSMNLMRFLLQSSRRTVIVATIAGAAAGATGIGLIALIQIELARIAGAG